MTSPTDAARQGLGLGKLDQVKRLMDSAVTAAEVPERTVAGDSPRLLALRLAIQSYGSVTTTGVEINILKRADAFARYLNGETDNRVLIRAIRSPPGA